MIYTLKDAHPSYRILEEKIIENDNIVHVTAKCDVDLPRFYFLKKFSPQKKLFYIHIDSKLDRQSKKFHLNITPLHHNYFDFSGDFSFDENDNVSEDAFNINYHYSVRLLSRFLDSKLKKLILEQIQQDFKILYAKIFHDIS